MTEQTQNPARLRSPRIPGMTGKAVDSIRIGRILRRRSKPGRAQRLAAAGKRIYVRGSMEGFVHTPWGRLEIARRRAARKVAHESRRRNRG